jgi:aminoglycoside 6'-N-acetyltransferase
VLPTLRDGGLTLRPLGDDDLDALLAMLAEPTVGEWWGSLDDLDHEREGLRNDGSAFAIEADGELAGWLGFTEEDEPEYRHAGLDILLALPHQDRGLGPRALRLAIDWLVSARGHHRFTIDPAAGNARAIAAYQKVGFRRVGILRKYERGPDGAWRDGLLMDLLAEELGSR